jgi:ubiquinol-cytochrome c reductase cytochrome b subunit
VIDVIVLGWVGGSPVKPLTVAVGQIASAYYFLHFLVILPLISAFETPLPLPTSIAASVLEGEETKAAPATGKSRRTKTATAAAE